MEEMHRAKYGERIRSFHALSELAKLPQEAWQKRGHARTKSSNSVITNHDWFWQPSPSLRLPFQIHLINIIKGIYIVHIREIQGF